MMSMRSLPIFTALALVLCGAGTMARAAKYATAFNDRADVTRSLRSEIHYREDRHIIEGGQTHDGAWTFDMQWNAREKVKSINRGVTMFSYEQKDGAVKLEFFGDLAGDSTDHFAQEDTLDAMNATYQRAASGEVIDVQAGNGKLQQYLALRPRNLVTMLPTNRYGLRQFDLLSLPFGHGLVFPAATMKDGATWSTNATVNMQVNFPVEVIAVFKIAGKQQIDTRQFLKITCTLAGKRGPEPGEWEKLAATITGKVDGKIIYLFDPAAGAVQQVTAELSSVQEIQQQGKTTKLTETLTTKLENVPVAESNVRD